MSNIGENIVMGRYNINTRMKGPGDDARPLELHVNGYLSDEHFSKGVCRQNITPA